MPVVGRAHRGRGCGVRGARRGRCGVWSGSPRHLLADRGRAQPKVPRCPRRRRPDPPPARRGAPTSFSSCPTRSASGAGCPTSVRLPWRERLMAEGIEFTRYFTHSSPCSPSRASLLTGPVPPRPRRDRQRDHARAQRARPVHGRRSARCCAVPATGPRTSGNGTCRSPSIPTWRPTGSRTGTATTAISWGGPAPASTSIPSSPPTPRSGSAPMLGRDPAARRRRGS